MTILNPRPAHLPGELLEGEVQIDAVATNAIRSIETTVLWFTEGKGDEDFGVHFFESRQQDDSPERDLRELHRFSTVLPQSPLSYDGKTVKICWCVRTRVFLRDGRKVAFEEGFVLGAVQSQLEQASQPAEHDDGSVTDTNSLSDTPTVAVDHDSTATKDASPQLNGRNSDGSAAVNASS